MDAIKKLALAHGEKVGMVIIVLAAGYIVYSSLGQPSLPSDKQASRIEQVSQSTKQAMDTYTWEKAKEVAREEVLEHTSLGSSAVKEVAADSYPITAWDRAVVPQSVLRTDPQLLAPIDLEVGAVTGLLAFLDENRIRELLREQAREEAEAQRARDEAASDGFGGIEPGRGGGRGPGLGRGGGARGGRNEGGGGGFGFGDGTEENENRRPVSAAIRPAGIPLDGTEKVVKMSVASVVAKVPIDKQWKTFMETLENSRGFDSLNDYPRYAGYYVERAEVIRGEELNWQPVMVRNGQDRQALPGVSPYSLAKSVRDWAQLMEDPADTRYIHPVLTFPLPPLVGRDWGDVARHSQVPLASEYIEAMENAENDEANPDDTSDSDIFGPNALSEGGRDGFGGEMAGGRGGMGVGGGRGGELGGGRGGMGMGGGRGGEMGRGGGRGGEMGRGGMGGGRGGFAAGGSFGGGNEFRAEVPFVMLRFFDFSVEPGKRYKYRVQLVMQDVNYGVPQQYLDRSVIDRVAPLLKAKKTQSLLKTEWSEPSPTVAVPQSGTGMLASMKPAVERNPNSEPSATILVSALSVDEKGFPIQASVEEEFRLGSLLAKKGDIEVLVDQNRFIEKKEDFEVDTGIVLLDLTGGEKLGRSEFNEPGLALMMDAGGRLFVKNELDDEVEVATHRAVFEEDPTMQPGGGFDGRGGERGGRGGEGGGFFGR